MPREINSYQSFNLNKFISFKILQYPQIQHMYLNMKGFEQKLQVTYLVYLLNEW